MQSNLREQLHTEMPTDHVSEPLPGARSFECCWASSQERLLLPAANDTPHQSRSAGAAPPAHWWIKPPLEPDARPQPTALAGSLQRPLKPQKASQSRPVPPAHPHLRADGGSQPALAHPVQATPPLSLDPARALQPAPQARDHDQARAPTDSAYS